MEQGTLCRSTSSDKVYHNHHYQYHYHSSQYGGKVEPKGCYPRREPKPQYAEPLRISEKQCYYHPSARNTAPSAHNQCEGNEEVLERHYYHHHYLTQGMMRTPCSDEDPVPRKKVKHCHYDETPVNSSSHSFHSAPRSEGSFQPLSKAQPHRNPVPYYSTSRPGPGHEFAPNESVQHNHHAFRPYEYPRYPPVPFRHSYPPSPHISTAPLPRRPAPTNFRIGVNVAEQGDYPPYSPQVTPVSTSSNINYITPSSSSVCSSNNNTPRSADSIRTEIENDLRIIKANHLDKPHSTTSQISPRRHCSPMQQRPTSKKLKPKKSKMYSNYIGVTYNKTHGKYQACITHYRKQHYLGRYKLATDAALAYDKGAKLLKGAGWKINFGSDEEYWVERCKEVHEKTTTNHPLPLPTNENPTDQTPHAKIHPTVSEASSHELPASDVESNADTTPTTCHYVTNRNNLYFDVPVEYLASTDTKDNDNTENQQPTPQHNSWSNQMHQYVDNTISLSVSSCSSSTFSDHEHTHDKDALPSLTCEKSTVTDDTKQIPCQLKPIETLNSSSNPTFLNSSAETRLKEIDVNANGMLEAASVLMNLTRQQF